MKSLTSYYIHECATDRVASIASSIFETKVDGDEIDVKDLDNDGMPDEFYMDLGNMVDSELDFEIGDDEEVGEGIKARAPKLKGKAEKARKNKANIMKSLMANPEIQGLITRLKTVLKRTARKEANTLGVNGRAINKALNGKVKI